MAEVGKGLQAGAADYCDLDGVYIEVGVSEIDRLGSGSGGIVPGYESATFAILRNPICTLRLVPATRRESIENYTVVCAAGQLFVDCPANTWVTRWWGSIPKR